jgi:hypothetical protein
MFILLNYVSAKSQTLPIEDLGFEPIAGAYYKDINNVFDQFVGTWRYTDGEYEITFRFIKLTNKTISNYTYDAIIGAQKIVKNNVVLIDNLNELNNLNLAYYYYPLGGTSIISNDTPPVCSTCLPNTKRIVAGYEEIINKIFAQLVIKAVPIAVGQPAKINVQVFYSDRTQDVNEPALPPPFLKKKNFDLIKIN